MELVNSAEAERWTVMRSGNSEGSEFSLCGHIHSSTDGALECARSWQAHSLSSFRFQIPGLEFVGPEADELARRFHSVEVDCGCPRCSGPDASHVSPRLIVAEDRQANAKMYPLQSDVVSALGNWLEWHTVLAEAVGACEALLAQGASGPYRVYLCDEAGRILGTAPTGNPKLYAHEPGREGYDDGFFTGQVAWDAFKKVVQSWLTENRNLGELALQ